MGGEISFQSYRRLVLMSPQGLEKIQKHLRKSTYSMRYTEKNSDMSNLGEQSGRSYFSVTRDASGGNFSNRSLIKDLSQILYQKKFHFQKNFFRGCRNVGWKGVNIEEET